MTFNTELCNSCKMITLCTYKMIRTSPSIQKYCTIENLPESCPCQDCIIKPICEEGCPERLKFEKNCLGIRYVDRCRIKVTF